MPPLAFAHAFPRIPFADYLDREIHSNEKHEYLHGSVYLMAGGTDRHDSIVMAVTLQLGMKLRRSRCFLRSSDMRIVTPDNDASFYPDLSIHCHAPVDGKASYLTAPTFILEVLSPSTSQYDLTTKRKEYFRIPSLCHYLLIDSESIEAHLYSRAAGQAWPRPAEIFRDLADVLALPALKAQLKLRDVYAQSGLVS
jgi:Uma2 family endonuclease